MISRYFKSNFLDSLLFLAVLILCPCVVFAETLVLTSGQEVEGEIAEKSDKFIKMDVEGIQVTYYSDEIESIDGHKFELTEENTPPSDFFSLPMPDVPAQTAENQGPWVKVENGRLWVKVNGAYKPYFIKAVGYSPIPISRHPSDWGWPAGDSRYNNIYDDPIILVRDFMFLKDMNANTIRIWKGDDTAEPNGRFPNRLTTRTLDLAAQYDLKVIAGFWVADLNFDILNNIVDRQALIDRFVAYVNTFKEHKAILFWAIGNENNYQKINEKGMSPQQVRVWYALVNDMAKSAHEAEGVNRHPVAVVNGDLDHIGDSSSGATDDQLPDLDIWGTNVYRGKNFGTLFSEYSAKSHKPLWIAEFGVDAWHGTDPDNFDNGHEDQGTQAVWVGALWDEIAHNSSVTIGGTVMAYADEWWKPSEWLCGDNSPSCNSTQNHFGSLFSAFPDGIMNQEWFGIMAIEHNPFSPQGMDIMQPRKLYYTLQTKWQFDAPLDSTIMLMSGQKVEGKIIEKIDNF